MPFKSKDQRAYLYANKPEIAKEFEAKTPKGVKLPQKVDKEEEDIDESFEQRIDKALSEGAPGASRGPTYGPEGITKGSAESEYSDVEKKKKRKKAEKVENEVLEAG